MVTSIPRKSSKVKSKQIKRKVLLLGDGAVGKTSLIRRFVIDKFDDKYIATIGTKVTKKELELESEGEIIYLTLMIWDVLGQKGYSSIQSVSISGAQGVIFVCDYTRTETLRNLEEYWIPLIGGNLPELQLVFVANKSDLADDAEFSIIDLQEMASKYDSIAYSSSAKTGENVEELFLTLGRKLMNVEGEIKDWESKAVDDLLDEMNIVVATDRIIHDFCDDFGDVDRAMPVIRHQFKKADVDIREPTRKGLMKVIDKLAEVERDYLDERKVRENRTRRRLWLERVKS